MPRGKIHDKMMGPWKPGESGNPAGGRKHNPEIRMLKRLTQEEFVDIGNMIISEDMASLTRIVKDDTETVLRRMVASVAKKVITTGDANTLDIFLNRLIGKVKDQVQVTGMGGGPLNIGFVRANQKKVEE